MKTSKRPLLHIATAGLLMLTVAACIGAPPPAPTDTAGLWEKIQAETANVSCTADSDCHTIGIGAKACGGPERYVAWSSKNTDGAKLKQLVAQHAAARKADDAREGVMSNCMMVTDPGASCQAGTCKVNGGLPGRASLPLNQQ